MEIARATFNSLARPTWSARLHCPPNLLFMIHLRIRDLSNVIYSVPLFGSELFQILNEAV